MKEIICPYCHEKLGVLKNEVSKAQGSIRCPYCNKGFGWHIHGEEVRYLW